jgi:hypothetical protein
LVTIVIKFETVFRFTIVQQTIELASPKERNMDQEFLNPYEKSMIRSKSALIDKLEETAV